MGNVQFNNSKVLFSDNAKVAMHSDCCCRACSQCNAGTTPGALKFVVSGMAEGAAGCGVGGQACSDLDGTYILTQVWNSNDCYYCDLIDELCDYGGGGSGGVDGVRAWIANDGTDTTIDFDFTSNTGACGSGTEEHKWTKTFTSGGNPSNCASQLSSPVGMTHGGDRLTTCDGSGATVTVEAA